MAKIEHERNYLLKMPDDIAITSYCMLLLLDRLIRKLTNVLKTCDGRR
jgi:hypothetical protein